MYGRRVRAVQHRAGTSHAQADEHLGAARFSPFMGRHNRRARLPLPLTLHRAGAAGDDSSLATLGVRPTPR